MDSKVENLIQKSGMITHHKVVNVLRGRKWDVLVSPYYYDNTSDKTKEIDVVAEKLFPVAGNEKYISIQLFIECKYIDKEVVFWFDDKDMKKAVEKVENDFNLELVGEGLRMAGDATTDPFHYLTDEKVAKLFSTNTNKEDVIYKALSQSLNAMIHYERLNIGSIMDDKKSLYRIIRQPIIVCDNFDNLLEVNLEHVNLPALKIDKNFQIEVNYIYQKDRRSEYSLIDVIDIKSLNSFLEHLEEEEVKPIRDKAIDDEGAKRFKQRQNKRKNPYRNL
ncbi:hypothetical protein HQ544_03390 [Candidatus Falkowbacteria bacterium]|nr:hypothetical protein [Candidatus Falkowbacteria bacterium]